ncbi:Transcriptional regulator ArcR [Streptococcus sp. DD10]|nr:Transcriptional regulator ArcR [Streptococcus sp. DD10]
MFKDGFYHYTAIAINEVEYFKIPTKLFEELSQKHIKQMTFLARKLSSILEFQELRLRNMVSGSATERVIQAISLLFVDLCLENESQLPFPINVKELARLSGTTRETTAKVIKTLQDDYRIRYQQKVLTILDRDFFLKYIN